MVQVLKSAHIKNVRLEQETKDLTEDDNISTEDDISSIEDDISSIEDDDSSTKDDNSSTEDWTVITGKTAEAVREVFTTLIDEETKKNGLENPIKAEMTQNKSSEKSFFMRSLLSCARKINNSTIGIEIGELAKKVDESEISKSVLSEASMELLKGNIIENKDREDDKENEDRENYKENTDRENGEENKRQENGGTNEKPENGGTNENGGEPNSDNQETRGWISRWIAVIVFWVQLAINAIRRAVKSFVNFVKSLFNFVIRFISSVRCPE